MNYQRRRNKLRKLLRQSDAMLVTNETNVTYLSGFTGDSSYLLVTKESDLLLSDPRYEEQIAEECSELLVFIRKPSQLLMPVTCQQIKRLGVGSVAVEGASLTLDMYDTLRDQLGSVVIHKGCGEVEGLRTIKDRDEIRLITQAVAIAERTFTSVRSQLMPAQTEREIAFEIERVIRVLGGEECAFDPIVAVGPRSALPHATPGPSRIGDSSFVLIDWGARVAGYRSDLTRVLLTSKIPAKIARSYEAVLAAQTAVIEAIQPGIKGSELDRIARDQLAGLSSRFTHGLGHGIGLDIHEAPRLGKNFDQPLQAGMVITVEPGVYFPGLGGIRIEDDVLVTQSGSQVLSSLPKGLETAQVELLG